MQRKIAVGAFNTANLEGLEAILGAAEELGLPVIAQFAQCHENLSPLEVIGPAMVYMAKRAAVPVCVHLDHGETLDYLKKALDIGFTSIMYDGSVLPYDENLKNTRLAVEMAGKAGASVEAELGSAEIAAVTGLKPHGMYSLPKIMWIKDHWPEMYRRAEHILLMEDFVVFRLTGTAQIDYSLATRTMAFDINALTWNRKILSAAGVDARLLSRPVPSGTAAGTLLPEAAKRPGLSTRLQVVSVSQDQVAGAVGAGVFDSGKALECAGTVECLTPVYDGMPPLEAMHRGNYAVVPYVVPGKYVTYCFSYTGGALIQWCADTLAKGEKELAAREGLSVHAYLERQAAEPTGLLVLPHFARWYNFEHNLCK